MSIRPIRSLVQVFSLCAQSNSQYLKVCGYLSFQSERFGMSDLKSLIRITASTDRTRCWSVGPGNAGFASEGALRPRVHPIVREASTSGVGFVCA